jgi:flagellar biosynthesis anti-sigma factor FlgM
LRSPPASGAHLARNSKLIEQVRQIIAAAPEVRAEKVAPLLEAVAAGTYEIDARKVANRLITELLLKR